ncbi:hypothetical protein EVAR_81016_1 [Eumeta japonica]|uniref:Uncharacterized protein n=1 Tax=Eumeta variegata TaxID=151549 RepID=A0A4C1T8I2_EUMVA|nr:hypothetical protein EVAR_81016_1 [Eumeta japonica]
MARYVSGAPPLLKLPRLEALPRGRALRLPIVGLTIVFWAIRTRVILVDVLQHLNSARQRGPVEYGVAFAPKVSFDSFVLFRPFSRDWDELTDESGFRARSTFPILVNDRFSCVVYPAKKLPLQWKVVPFDGIGSIICLATEFTEFTLSRPASRAGRGNGGGRQSRVGSFELLLFVPRSCCGRQLAVLRARVI